ncbi:hypothetical protein COU05_01880 [bacterium (Candidatus Gribaldobacteria) CG10_big_fil_rev_8_21_14_0_10_37_21]|uniref:Nudix hydrolase domain-containing protein n=1 Tax=bacterium (Candidatus Gribaldobacteria) CG10_big_fil_rev_8_21_14_0_10_37_21 TaxID=2014275 RepID=A0A2H0UW92_9BACT|nr:MAG: hypothetical protein AUJ25_02020 [Parcubacteria group bacterium CG1_02_37_13]PIR90459.1 MAG: hypothetical protein COU05_01880 [bacterium (Candidatus Gribaldobacteria) CG10_big_fil_rev_8_21_14_0_10_37_21]
MNPNEEILVIKRDIIFKDTIWQGLKTDNLEHFLDIIKNNFEFKRRGDVENDPSFQQIIPYILFNFENKYFLYKYLEKAGEQRLINDYMLGVAGHINPVDNKQENTIEAGMMREWEEEVDFQGNLLEKKLIGILNDDSRPVEAVHLGLVYLFKGDSAKIVVKEKETIKGEMMTLPEIALCMEKSGGWAPIIYHSYLKTL